MLFTTDDAIDCGSQKEDGKENLSTKDCETPQAGGVVIGADRDSVPNAVIESLLPAFHTLKTALKDQDDVGIGECNLKITHKYQHQTSLKVYRVPSLRSTAEDKLAYPQLEYVNLPENYDTQQKPKEPEYIFRRMTE